MTQTTEREPLGDALAVVRQIIDAVGEDMIGSLTFNRSVIAIQPSHLNQAEAIARQLGLNNFVDHQSLVPPVTDWSGAWPGPSEPYELHVRGTRQSVAATA